MPRPPRLQVAGGVYHVMSRGVVGQAIFRTGFDHELFLLKLGLAVERCGWSCHAYCLLTTHYHLLIRTPEPNLAKGMQLLLSQYAQAFNRRRDGFGHVVAERYRSVLVEREEQLLELCRYLALNPVRGGLCDDPTDWPWSSYAAIVGLELPPPFLTVEWLLAMFGSDQANARSRLRAFVMAKLADERSRADLGV